MQETLVIFLKSFPMQMVDWVLLSVNHDVSRCEQDVTPETLSDVLQDKKVIVVLPPYDVTLTTIHLPEMSHARAMQAAPFAIEEDVLSDVSTLHVAIGERATGEPLPVAVIEKSLMKHCLEQLMAFHIKPSHLVAAYEGMVRDEKNVARLCEKAFFADVVCAPCKDERCLQAKTISTTPFIDLLQGEFKQKSSYFLLSSSWKYVVIFAAIWATLLVISPLISRLILQPKVDRLNNQIAVIYHTYFPQNKKIIAPLKRLRAYAKEQVGAGADDKALYLLALLSEDDNKNADIEMKQFQYQQNQLTVELIASSSEALSQFVSSLTAKGLLVKQQSAMLQGERVDATLQVSEAAS